MSETGRPGRYTRSTSGLIGAMLILFVAVIGFVVFRGLFRTETEYIPPDTDYVEVVRAVQDEGGELVYPEQLPEGWVVNNLDYEPGLPPTFSLALLTDDEDFAGVIDTGAEVDDLVTSFVDQAAVEGDPLVLEAAEVTTEWRTFTDDGGDTAYVAEIDLAPVAGDDATAADAIGEDVTRTVMVYGSADPEVLQDLLASLTTAPLR
ncbi:DUF4245 family protein [Nocardioides salarius]|uniref:DUF4245 family protein n=1 Tax=Nocardioides salarius TaxID=374513 RepID=UPI0030FA52EF